MDSKPHSVALTVDQSGHILIAGFRYLPSSSPYRVVQFIRIFDETGVELLAADSGWARELGAAPPMAVAADGTIYGAGGNDGPRGNKGWVSDAIIRKYGESGHEIWTRVISAPVFPGAAARAFNEHGSPPFSRGTDVVLDREDNPRIFGTTQGVLPGQMGAGEEDIFWRKYDPDGNLLSTHQFGTPGGDVITGVGADELGNVYVAGSAHDIDYVTVFKFDANGAELWRNQYEYARSSRASDIAVGPHGDVLIVGSISEGYGAVEAFVRKIGPDGFESWDKVFAIYSTVRLSSVAIDAEGNVYVGGTISGNDPDRVHGLLSKLDASGKVTWSRKWIRDGPLTDADMEPPLPTPTPVPTRNPNASPIPSTTGKCASERSTPPEYLREEDAERWLRIKDDPDRSSGWRRVLRLVEIRSKYWETIHQVAGVRGIQINPPRVSGLRQGDPVIIVELDVREDYEKWRLPQMLEGCEVVIEDWEPAQPV